MILLDGLESRHTCSQVKLLGLSSANGAQFRIRIQNIEPSAQLGDAKRSYQPIWKMQ